MLRTLIALLIGVAATLAWQAYGDRAKAMIATMAPSLAPFLSVSAAKPSPDGQATAQNAAAAQAMPSAQNPAPANSATPPHLVQQQLETMTGDLGAMRASLDQLAAKQDQMAQTIAALQAVEQDIKQKLSAAPPAQAVPIPRRKPPPHVARSPAAPSSSVSPPPEPVPPPPVDQPASRPPAPLH